MCRADRAAGTLGPHVLCGLSRGGYPSYAAAAARVAQAHPTREPFVVRVLPLTLTSPTHPCDECGKREGEQLGPGAHICPCCFDHLRA